MNVQCSDVSRSFAKEMRALKMRHAVPAIRSWQRPIERIIEAKLLTTPREAAQELIDHSTVIWHLKQTGKVKNVYNWCLTSWPKIKKKLAFFSVIFFYSAQQQWTISRMNGLRKVDFIPQLAMTSSVTGPRKRQNISQSPAYIKKGHDHCLGVCCPLIQYNFMNRGKTITSEKYAQQINEMHQKLQQLHRALVNRMGPILLQDVNFCLRCHIHLIFHQLTTISSISTTFCRENTAIISKRQEMLS